MELLPNKDIYTARELTYLRTGTDYESISRCEIMATIKHVMEKDMVQGILRYTRWPDGGVVSSLYVMRNVEKYRNNRRAILEHLRSLPFPKDFAVALAMQQKVGMQQGMQQG